MNQPTSHNHIDSTPPSLDLVLGLRVERFGGPSSKGDHTARRERRA